MTHALRLAAVDALRVLRVHWEVRGGKDCADGAQAHAAIRNLSAALAMEDRGAEDMPRIELITRSALAAAATLLEDLQKGMAGRSLPFLDQARVRLVARKVETAIDELPPPELVVEQWASVHVGDG